MTLNEIEDMDMYSDVFHAKECFSALSYLARRVFLTKINTGQIFEPTVYWKQSIYLTQGRGKVYTSLSPNPTCGITLDMLLLLW